MLCVEEIWVMGARNSKYFPETEQKELSMIRLFLPQLSMIQSFLPQ